ncbi:MAG: hypothetical protein CO108_05255, partial [Deltaproteobacteria bacterium CG_4_9_14_3_um_filter_63_12]
DDGNTTNTDACVGACLNAACHDGYVQSGVEQCDDGNTTNNDACVGACVNARCGDTYLWNVSGGTETCDDGNINNGDGCNSICVIEPSSCYTGSRINTVQGFAGSFPASGTAPFVSGGMEFWIFGEDYWNYSGCNGDNDAFYSTGGGNSPTRIKRDNGSNFQMLEFTGGDGWGQCTNFGYAEIYQGGTLIGTCNLDGAANSTVYGFAGSFDEVRVAFFQDAATRDAHNMAAYSAGLVDNVSSKTSFYLLRVKLVGLH